MSDSHIIIPNIFSQPDVAGVYIPAQKILSAPPPISAVIRLFLALSDSTPPPPLNRNIYPCPTSIPPELIETFFPKILSLALVIASQLASFYLLYHVFYQVSDSHTIILNKFSQSDVAGIYILAPKKLSTLPQPNLNRNQAVFFALPYLTSAPPPSAGIYTPARTLRLLS